MRFHVDEYKRIHQASIGLSTNPMTLPRAISWAMDCDAALSVVRDADGKPLCVVFNNSVYRAASWTPADELPDPSMDGRKFHLLSYRVERVGVYCAEEGGWIDSADGVLMDVTQYWSEPLPLPPAKETKRP